MNDSIQTGPPLTANEATRGSAIKLAADTIGRVLSFATTVWIARRLGPEGFGVFQVLSAVAVVVADFSDLGLQLTATRALVARTLRLSDLIRSRLVLTVPMAAIFVAVYSRMPVLAWLVLFFTLSNWCEFAGVALRARGRRIEEASVLAFLRTACLVFVVLAGADIVRMAQAHVLSTLLPLGAAVWLLHRAYRSFDLRIPHNRPAHVIRVAMPLGLNNLLTLGNMRLELYVLPLLSSKAEVGLYAVGLQAVYFLASVPAAVAQGALPALTHEAMSRDTDTVRRRTAMTAALLALPAASALALIGPEMLVYLGRSYEVAGGPLRLLALAVVPIFFNGILSHALVAAGRGQVLPRLTAWRLGVALAAAMLLIPALGARGAAIGFTIAETGLLVGLMRSNRTAGFTVRILNPLLVSMALTLPMTAAVCLCRSALFVRIVAGVVVYALTLSIAFKTSLRLRRLFG